MSNKEYLKRYREEHKEEIKQKNMNTILLIRKE